jgi:hypothetical protein
MALAALSQFQNCGKTPGSTAATSGRISPQSPFYDQRVRLDLPEEKILKASLQENETIDRKQISILLHNSCAMNACEKADEPEKSISCQILEKNEILKGLEDSAQSYVWLLEAETQSDSFEQILRSNDVDDQCVVGVSYNHSYKIDVYTTNDPGYASQYYHQTLNAPDAYEFFYAASLPTVYVAVIDTGFQSHEDLTRGTNIRVGTSCDDICHWHGNFVSGIIASRRNNSRGGQGIAPNAYVYNFQIGDQNGNLTSSELVNALQVSNTYSEVELVNLSLGGSGLYDFGVQDAIMTSISKGRVVVVAAGNNARDIGVNPIYPAAFNFDGQITVAAASPGGVVGKTLPVTGAQIASPIIRDTFSNYSSGLVHIAAPGSNIYSTTLNNTYGVYNGTSFAAPMVTGTLALMKGFLKKSGYDVSPQILRSLLFEGSRSVPTLSQTVGGIEEKMVQNNRFLDLGMIKNTLVNFTANAGSKPGEIQLVESFVRTVSGKKEIVVRVDVRNADPNAGLILTAYTNSAFLSETATGYTCKIESTRQVCDVVIDFNSLLANPEVYLRVTDPTGKIISDLKIPKTAINLGDKTIAALKGEIVAAYHFDKNFQIEGWACLEGFADAITIEVRLNSNTGTPYQTLSTNRQARGNYFTECNAPEISFGFRYVVPASLVESNSAKAFFFRAVHSETGKTRDLPVFTYQPTYEDTRPATTTTSVYLDKGLSDRNLDLKITRREFNNFILTLEGSACYRNSRKPATFTIGLNSASDQIEFLKMIPEFRSTLPPSALGSTVASVQEAVASYASISKSASSVNPVKKGIDDRGWLGNVDLFSETYNSFKYTPSGSEASKGFLLYIGDQMKLMSGLRTITPSINRGDGCAFPSGFSVSIDIRPYIDSISAGVSISYRSDIYTEAQVLARPDLAEYLTLLNLPASIQSDFSSLIFNARAFNFYVESTLGAQKFSVFMDKNIFEHAVMFNYQGRSLAKGWQSIQLNDAGRHQNLTDYMKPDYRSISFPSPIVTTTVNTQIWHDPMAINLTASTNTTLSQVYLGDVVPASSKANRLFVALILDEASTFGELNKDFKVQVRYNGTGSWYEIPLQQLSYNSTNNRSILTSSTDFSIATATSVQFRVLANGKNAFKISSLGFMTE